MGVLELGPLQTQHGVEMIRASCKWVSEADARVITRSFNSNPTMLGIVIGALKDRDMTTEEAKGGQDLCEFEANLTVEQVNTDERR